LTVPIADVLLLDLFDDLDSDVLVLLVRNQTDRGRTVPILGQPQGAY